MIDSLSNDLAILLELAKAGRWSDVTIDTPNLSVRFSNDPSARNGALPSKPEFNPASVIGHSSSRAEAESAPTAPLTGDPSWRAITAPNLGTFYRSPKPGSAPFVEIGDQVTAETEICLLEVMKLFTSVTAGVAGVVRAIVAHDAELVEGGQILFHIEPRES